MANYGESCVVSSVLETVLSGRGIGKWINGVRLDVDALGKLVERTGAFLIVDGIREAGVRRLALRRVDFYAADTQKWFIVPSSVDLTYVGRRWVILTA